jgi:Holliday junction resolvase RusA-like endonuclease
MSDRLVEGEGLSFVVVGKPAPGGSKTARPLGDGRTVVRPANKRTKPWMRLVSAAATSAWEGYPPIDAPVEVRVVFFYERPRAARGLRWPLRTGNDLDKLLRATLDPLEGVMLANDRRIVRIVAERRFGSPERAEIEVVRLESEALAPEESGQLALA